MFHHFVSSYFLLGSVVNAFRAFNIGLLFRNLPSHLRSLCSNNAKSLSVVCRPTRPRTRCTKPLPSTAPSSRPSSFRTRAAADPAGLDSSSLPMSSRPSARSRIRSNVRVSVSKIFFMFVSTYSIVFSSLWLCFVLSLFFSH